MDAKSRLTPFAFLLFLTACNAGVPSTPPSVQTAARTAKTGIAHASKRCQTVSGAQLCVYLTSPAQPTGYGIVVGGNILYGNDAQYFGDSPIDVIAPSGAISQLPPLSGFGIGFIENVVVGPDKRLWFAPNIPERPYPPPLPTLFAETTTGGDVGRYNLGPVVIGAVQVVAGPDGAMWLTCLRPGSHGNVEVGCIQRVTTRGIVATPKLTAAFDPTGPIASAYGKLWFANGTGSDRLGRITMPHVIDAVSIGKNAKGNAWSPQMFFLAYGSLWTIVADVSYTTPSPDNVADKVCKITPKPALSRCQTIPIYGSPGGAMGLAITSDGTAWVSTPGTTQGDAKHPAIFHIARSGTVTTYPLARAPMQFPAGIVANGKSLWFALPVQSGFGQLTP